MAKGFCYTCNKYLMFGSNFVFWLLGCAILIVGIWMRVDEDAMGFMAESPRLKIVYIATYVMMVLGFVLIHIGFLGYCGAIKESQGMLITLSVFLGLISVILIGLGTGAVVAKESFRDISKDMLQEGVDEYETKDASMRFMDLLQVNLQCCGVKKGWEDYGKEKEQVPCHKEDYDKPCADPLYYWVEDKLVTIAGACFGIAVLLIFGMLFSVVLVYFIRHRTSAAGITNPEK